MNALVPKMTYWPLSHPIYGIGLPILATKPSLLEIHENGPQLSTVKKDGTNRFNWQATCGDSLGCSWLKQPHCHMLLICAFYGENHSLSLDQGTGRTICKIPGEHFHIIPNSLESVPLGMSCRLPDKRMTRINLARVSIYPRYVILYQEVSIHLWKMLLLAVYRWFINHQYMSSIYLPRFHWQMKVLR